MVVDSSYVQKPLAMDLEELTGSRIHHVGLWARLEASRRQRQGHLKVVKITSHQSAAEALSKGVPWGHWAANLAADAAAGWAAGRVALPPSIVKEIVIDDLNNGILFS
jgi:hypothetical protein